MAGQKRTLANYRGGGTAKPKGMIGYQGGGMVNPDINVNKGALGLYRGGGKVGKGGPNTGALRSCIANKMKTGMNFRQAQVQCALGKNKKK